MRTLEFWNDVVFKCTAMEVASKISGFMSLLSEAEQKQPLLNIVGLPRNLDDGYVMVSMSPEEHKQWVTLQEAMKKTPVPQTDEKLAEKIFESFGEDTPFFRRDIARVHGAYAYERFDFVKKLQITWAGCTYRFRKLGDRGKTCMWIVEEVG